MKRILIAEGNHSASRQLSREIGGCTHGERYAEVLQEICPGIVTDLYDLPDSDDPPPARLDSYDGVVLTGSALNICEDRPEVRRQITFARRVFEVGLPFFGSCWGLQVANVAAGGEVQANPRGREIGFARRVTLNRTGEIHPMHQGRPVCFDALAIHTDHVTRPAEGMIVTAGNSISAVQAAEIRHGNGVFWGVQYHPEYSLRDLCDVLIRFSATLVEEEHLFAGREELECYISDLRMLEDDPRRRDIAWIYGIDADVLDKSCRYRELINWLRCQLGAETALSGAGKDYLNYNHQRV